MVLLGRVCKLCRNTTDPPFAARTSSDLITELDRSWGLQEVKAHRISRQLAHANGKLVGPMHRSPLTHPPLPQEIFLVIISFRDLVDLRNIVLPEGLRQ